MVLAPIAHTLHSQTFEVSDFDNDMHMFKAGISLGEGLPLQQGLASIPISGGGAYHYALMQSGNKSKHQRLSTESMRRYFRRNHEIPC